jgi:ArsR family transcriptional regulator
VKEFITITKALSDVNRVRILLALDGRELCVCQLIVLLGLAPSTVSKHLWILKQAGLVDLRKEGRWSYYHINYESPSELILQAINWTITSNRSSPLIMKDNKRLQEILKKKLDELCQSIPGPSTH